MGLLANVEKREPVLKPPSLVARAVGPLGGGSNAHKAKLRLHGIVELGTTPRESWTCRPPKQKPLSTSGWNWLLQRGLARVAGGSWGRGGACCRLNCLCSRPRCMGERDGGQIGSHKKGLAVHNSNATHAPAAPPGIMSMATLYKPNYDGLFSPCPEEFSPCHHT